MEISANSIVLITGASSGIGYATAQLFADRGWQVIATMRDPESHRAKLDHKNITLLPLDVTKSETIDAVVKHIVDHGGRLDAVVNNAGFGLYGAFEQFTDAEVRQQYDVNVFGVMAVCRALIPVLRKQGSGTIVNVASMGGRYVIPYYSVYCSTKFAIEGISEGLWHELQPFGIKVKVVEPGAVNTDFYSRSMKTGTANISDEVYDATVKRTWQNYAAAGVHGLSPKSVAKVIYKAAMSSSPRLHYPAGITTKIYIALSRWLPHVWWLRLLQRYTVRG